MLVVEGFIRGLRAMLGRLARVLSRRDPLGVIVAVAIGIGAYFLVEAIVGGLLVPIISIFIGDSHFETNSFTISGSEFRYGIAIEYLLSFVVLVGLGYAVLAAGGDPSDGDDSGPRRRCPECTMSIPATATRCPHCTAHVAPTDGA